LSIYFLDSSGLVKRYTAEIGTAWVQSITDPSVSNKIYIAQITGVEVIAAIRARATKHRPPSVSLPDAVSVINNFTLDFDNQYIRIEVTDQLIREAMRLTDKHALRAYDAVQLAAALEINNDVISEGLPPVVLISADRNLNVAGQAEGLTTDDPNNH